MRNRSSKKFKVIKASHCFSQWLETGTSLLNRESDLIGLSTYLWHEDLKRPLSEARLADVLDLEYDVFDQTLDDDEPEIRFRAHPSRVQQIFQKTQKAMQIWSTRSSVSQWTLIFSCFEERKQP